MQAPHAADTPTYHAFLLRLWCDADVQRWHASLQTVDGTARRGFADLDQLITYLHRLVCPPADIDPPTGTPVAPFAQDDVIL